MTGGSDRALPSFATLLRRHRRAAGLTQGALAERSRVSVPAISALERGWHRSARRETAAMLAGALGLTGPERDAFFAAARRPVTGAGAEADPDVPDGQASLRQPPGDLVGREEELRAARSLLLDEGRRLLTLTGPPGVGKTRLAIALAQDLRADFDDRAVFVGLAALTDGGLLDVTIGRALGIRDDEEDSGADRLAAHIGDRRLLLVLDNFEQLLPAAPLLSELLAACPGLHLLVTSRSALRLHDEQELLVPPLSLPDAVTLFVLRARARSPRFALTPRNEAAVAEICRRLDRLPMALELAAPWIRLLSEDGLLARMDDRLDMLVGGSRDLPERQRAIRRTLAWSYDLLEADEQVLFRWLSVFTGGAELAAVEGVWAGRPAGPLAIEVVAGLMDKSLLAGEAGAGGEAGEGTWLRMLETTREYASELLGAGGEREAASRAHARWYGALLERAEPRLAGPERAHWLSRLERELPNLRAALRWAREAGEHELGVTLAARLRPLWEQGRVREGLTTLTEWLDSGVELPAGVRARALDAVVALSFRRGEHRATDRYGTAALALHRAAGDRRASAAVLNYLSGSAWEQGRLDRAIDLCEQSLALRRELGSQQELAGSLANLAILLSERGDERAVDLLEEAAERYRSDDSSNPRGLTFALGALANHALVRGRLDDAAALLDECFAVLDGRPDLLAASQTVFHRGQLGLARGDLAAAAADFREALRSWHRLGNVTQTADAVEAIAEVAWLEGEPERAARLYGAGRALREQAGGSARWFDRAEHERVRRQVRQALGEERYGAELAAGRRLPPERMVAAALGED